MASKVYDVTQITKAVGRSASSVWVDRTKADCPLHKDGMRRQRGGRRLVATADVLASYKAWLAELVPAQGGSA
jgi:hypothetical protein